MARPREPDAVRLTGYPAGVNNVAPQHDLPVDENAVPVALVAAINVDLVGPKKQPRRREGYALKVAGRAHSPAAMGDHLLAVLDGNLVGYDRMLLPAYTVRLGVGSRRLSYAQVNDDLYWSSPTEIRRIRGGDLADLPAWIDCPGVPAVTAHAQGGMAAGTYRVAMTWLDDEGRESGANGIAEVDVADGQGIHVSNIPVAPEGAVQARVYVSSANGDELYAEADISTSVVNYLLGAGSGEGGKALETLWRQPLPPCEILRYWNARLLGAAGNLLVWSDAIRHGLTTHDNYMRFGQKITLLEPIGKGENSAGVFIADHKNVYWMDGDAPDKWRRVIRYDHPAVPGVSLVVKGTDIGLETAENVVFFLAANGVFCAGLPGGRVQPLTEGRLALPGGDEGAVLFREHAGLRQLIASYISTTPNQLAVGDRVSASVTRHTN